MRGKFWSSAAAIFIGALFVAGEAIATGTPPPPPLVIRQTEAPPMQCSTVNGTTITANPLNSPQFPVPVTCPASPGGQCYLYEYSITRAPTSPMKIDFTEISVSVTQAVNSTNPVATVIQPAFGGSSDFLEGARHEYTIKFDSGANIYDIPSLQIYVRPTPGENSRARVGTIQVKGATRQGCLIATPGTISGDVFQPVTAQQTVTVAGGNCIATFASDANGEFIFPPLSIINAPNAPFGTVCQAVQVDTVFLDGLAAQKPLKNNTSPLGVTFGTGTTTCYGPPRPSRPICVCTAPPCP